MHGAMLAPPPATSDEATARSVGDVFLHFDGGAKGHLTRHEFRCAHIALLGHPPSLVRSAGPSAVFS